MTVCAILFHIKHRPASPCTQLAVKLAVIRKLPQVRNNLIMIQSRTSLVLSRKKQATAKRMEEVNSKYGTDVYDIAMILDQFAAANTLNQMRVSVNSP